MAHFAELDENNLVLRVLVVDNADVQNLPFPESESLGVAFLNTLFPDTRWVQTSYNNNFRMRYAGPGMEFHPATETLLQGSFAFPKQYNYFVWSDEKGDWIPPTPYPTTGRNYFWDHDAYAWIPFGPVPFTSIGA